jgi:hypothetical protein
MSMRNLASMDVNFGIPWLIPWDAQRDALAEH